MTVMLTQLGQMLVTGAAVTGTRRLTALDKSCKLRFQALSWIKQKVCDVRSFGGRNDSHVVGTTLN